MVDRGTPNPSGHQMRSFLLSHPIRNDLYLHLQRNPTGTVMKPAGAIQKTGFAFLPPASHPPIGGLPRHSHRFSRLGYRPTQLEDSIHQQLASKRRQPCSVEGPPGILNQIDVLTTYSDGIQRYRTAISCRWREKKVRISHVREIALIVQDAHLSSTAGEIPV